MFHATRVIGALFGISSLPRFLQRFTLPKLVMLACLSGVPTGVYSAQLAGHVLNQDGLGLADVLVIARHLDTYFGGVAITDSSGRFQINDLPTGEYAVITKKVGFLPQRISTQIGLGATELIDIRVSRVMMGHPVNVYFRNPNNYTIIEVLYGTDRTRQEDFRYSGNYDAGRGQLEFGSANVSIPRDHRYGSLDSPTWWRLEFRPDPEKHIVYHSTEPSTESEFLGRLREKTSASESKSAFIFVHGFNVTFKDAVRRTAQLAYDLGFDGAPISYSWPSNGRLLQYVADEQNARWSHKNLSDFIRSVAKVSPRIHVMAHSMGNQVLTLALRDLVQNNPATLTHLAQIVLVAPDIDTSVFERDIAPLIADVGERRTLYASSEDKALLISKSIRADYPRLGDVSDGIVILNGVDSIDVSRVRTDFMKHAYYGDSASVIADLYYLLQHGLAPSQRFGMREVRTDGYLYWVYGGE